MNASGPQMRVNDEPSPRLAVDAVASVTAKRFFIFMFLCRMPSEAVFLCRLPTDSGGPLVACGNEPKEVQNGVQELFLFF